MSRVLAIVQDQIRRNKEGLLNRLLKHSERQPPQPGQTVGCLLWRAAKNNDGYPKMNFVFRGKHYTIYVHHVTHALHTGKEVPEGTERDHTCNTRHCIEPRHLEPVTHKENLRRKRMRMFQRWGYAEAVAEMEKEAA